MFTLWMRVSRIFEFSVGHALINWCTCALWMAIHHLVSLRLVRFTDTTNHSYVNSAQLYASIDIHLIQHSTGQPHPAAARPVLHFDNIHYLPGHCSIMLEVAGDTLCFLLNNYFPFVSADPVTLVVYNWKTGHPVVVSYRAWRAVER